MKTDEEILATNAHISDHELETDIADTQCEIDELRQRIKAYRELTISGPEHEKRLYAFKADAHESGIKERLEFIRKLNHLSELRRQKQLAAYHGQK